MNDEDKNEMDRAAYEAGPFVGLPLVAFRDGFRAALAHRDKEIQRLRKVMEVCASMAGKDWLKGQLALAEALDAPYGTENLDAVLLRAGIDPIPYRPTGASDEREAIRPRHELRPATGRRIRAAL